MVGVSAHERFAPHAPSLSPSFSPSEYSHQIAMHPHKRQRREREEPSPAGTSALTAVPMSHESMLDVVTDSGRTGHIPHRQHVGGKAENVVMVSRSAHYSV